MEELLRTTDITVTAYVRAILIDASIEPFELDVNMSVLEGSIGILPRRIMVRSDELVAARILMKAHDIDVKEV
jgi:hypothetical protein